MFRHAYGRRFSAKLKTIPLPLPQQKWTAPPHYQFDHLTITIITTITVVNTNTAAQYITNDA